MTRCAETQYYCCWWNKTFPSLLAHTDCVFSGSRIRPVVVQSNTCAASVFLQLKQDRKLAVQLPSLCPMYRRNILERFEWEGERKRGWWESQRKTYPMGDPFQNLMVTGPFSSKINTFERRICNVLSSDRSWSIHMKPFLLWLYNFILRNCTQRTRQNQMKNLTLSLENLRCENNTLFVSTPLFRISRLKFFNVLHLSCLDEQVKESKKNYYCCFIDWLFRGGGVS